MSNEPREDITPQENYDLGYHFGHIDGSRAPTELLSRYREALKDIRDHYRSRNLECKYCGEAAAKAESALTEGNDVG